MIISSQKNKEILSIVIANAVPLFGVLFFGWNLSIVMILFWCENVILGVFNVFKMILAKQGKGKLFHTLFFAFHYGLFTLVHGIFVFVFFGNVSFGGNTSVQFLMNIQGVALGVAFIVASYFLSFFSNYVMAKEYEHANVEELFTEPYSRTVIMHITIIGGAFLILLTGQSLFALLLLIVLKSIFEAKNRASIKVALS